VKKLALRVSALVAFASVAAFVAAPACAPASPAPEHQIATTSSALTDGGGGGAPTKGSLVISQVYGGGGGANATYLNDYVELLNRTKTPIALDGLSLQVATADGDFGAGAASAMALSGTVGPGQYVLIQLDSANPGDGDPLPPADLTGNLALGETQGKVALAPTAAPLGCGGLNGRCSPDKVLDLVGYGLVSDFEGTQFVLPLDVQHAAIRKDNGCTDTNDNRKDFTVDRPAPRNGSQTADCPQTNPQKDGGGPAGPVPPVRDPALGPEAPGPDAGQARDAGARPSGGASSDCAVAHVGRRADRLPVASMLALALAIAVTRRTRRARRAAA
jgi:hypothetical protein